MKIPMPPRNTTAEVVARAVARCLRFACEKRFEKVAIGDFGEVISGGTPSTDKPDYWHGDVVWVTPKDLGKLRTIEIDDAERTITELGVSESSARLLPAGTVLLSSRAPIGYLAIAKKPLATNQGFKNIICSKRANNRFIFHLLRGSIEDLGAEGRGNTFLEIPAKVVRSFLLPLPPLPIQQAIAAFLDVLYRRLANEDVPLPELPPPLAELRRVVARIEELAAQIHEARVLRCQAAEEAEALVAAASAKLFEPKEGWETKTVGDFCEPPQYGYTESATDQAIGPHFLRITDIQEGKVNWEHVPYCRCPEPSKYLLKPNDLVFARTGATTGKSFVIRDCPEAVFASYLIRLRVRDTVSVDYLYLYFQSPGYWEQIADEKKGTGQPNLNGSKLARLKVPVAPLAEQRRIVAELAILEAELDVLKRLQAETASEIDALLPSILDKAFRGEL